VNQEIPHVVIAGAGHAGGSAAAFLRQLEWPGSITLIGEEPIPPYQRPPLSKAWLKGEATAESLALRPAGFYPGAAIDLRLETRVTGLERANKTVVLSDGTAVPYDVLILATGARALGVDVTIIECESRVLARVACPILSDFFQAFHRGQGVVIETAARVVGLEGTAGNVTGVRLGDGRLIACDAVLVGVGAMANDELARAAGLSCDNGIVVDLMAQTDDPAIFAIGDCTSRPLPLYARRGRLESVPNAIEQARQAACLICGKPPPAPEVPWFWSDQYDLRLQIAGLPFDATEIALRGDVGTAKFALFHLTGDGTVQAVEAVNASTEFMGGRKIILGRKRLTRARIEDMSVSMKELAA